MRVDLSIDVERSIAHAVTDEFLRENVGLVLSCISQGKAKGVAMHPGMTLEWKVTTDEDAFV
jgi:hypothetical protein